MSNFDSTKRSLISILDEIVTGKIQLPDFQRGWVWDDEHIRSLLVSVARAFPIGSIMLLETGGNAKFQVRLVEGVDTGTAAAIPERLILDGQQRLTSLVQVLKLWNPVKTRDGQKREVERFYYIDIEEAMQGNSHIEDAIVGLDGTRLLKRNFGREIILDLSAPANEFSKFYFPCNQILNSDDWEKGLWTHAPEKFPRYMDFRTQVLVPIRHYEVPIIDLKKENSKEAVCLVFEKVNTGGVALSVFELVTASYAVDGFNLRDDWYGSETRQITGRKRAFAARPLLREIEPTDFLQGISLLYTYALREQDLSSGRTGKEVTTVNAKREQVLALPLEAYREWADRLVDGFTKTDHFLKMEGFRQAEFLPYRTQLVPLAAVMVRLGERWLEPVIYKKLSKWFWCGVFGELYGGAIETRIALDMQDVLGWIFEISAPEPATVIAAGFQASRLDTLRTRTSAAYRGLYILLQREGSQDFFWRTQMKNLEDYHEWFIDIHHIFPRAWCRAHGISDRVFNAIVNKTPISYKANRMIGGKPPSVYLDQVREHPQVQISVAEQDEILRTHLIEPSYLRADDFAGFYEQRKQKLVELVERAMGKSAVTTNEAPPDDVDEDVSAEEASA